MKIKQNVILAKHTTYKIGGPADYFIGVKNIDELKQALKFADDNALPKFILAGGSNILFSDEGYRGLIIKIDNSGLEIKDDKIMADAGVFMCDLVGQSVEKGLAGLEWAGGLPGTVGGAIRGNAGCFGNETKNAVVEVIAMTENGELKTYPNADCEFGYRDSAFKRNGEIILSAVFKLKSGNREKLKAEIFDHIKYRKARHRMPSCGSVFKNISGMPAGTLIEACGLKGKIIGGARITEEHANIIHNFNNAKAIDVLELMNLAKEEAEKQFGIKLEEEVQLVI